MTDEPRDLDEPAERAAVHRDALPAFDPAEPQEPPLHPVPVTFRTVLPLQ